MEVSTVPRIRHGFYVDAEEVRVFVRRREGSWWNNNQPSYTITGKGSRKFRKEIIKSVEGFLIGD